ncbi:ubiquinone/menaquinone biosynthesis C-methylase UbiE [Micromonospora sp. Llam0]|uniref:class I SAM-dependent methyltransferase n=1 Tax=Micromonospora sp. Llam0 TaxID=2485143 RepID=UPI000F4680EA|nr:class I SAM-dependent methyltransferase [Micromonospora sp. Llam0]ROO52818.1 ubiquinone/menaquinone biosynthesis C-methylase UbiE [Micromonospora sp. Llam0]
MRLGFSGEVVDYYHKYRRGYPSPVIDALVAALQLRDDDIVVDLGCGTGQLTLPLARRVRAVVGMDPEPDMLERARDVAGKQDTTNVTWILGADSDIPALGALLDSPTLGAVTIGQALHWMDPDTLFNNLAPLVRNGGGVAILTNGSPAWLQDTTWSKSLRSFLEGWLVRPLTFTCGSDGASQQRYAASLRRAGFHVSETTVEYTAEIDLEHLIGGVYSALSTDHLPAPEQRPEFAEQIRQALHPVDRFSEHVRVMMLIGQKN